MSKPTTLQDIFNNSYKSIVNDDGTSSERFNEDFAKQAIEQLLIEAKIEEVEQINSYIPMNIDQSNKLMSRLTTLKKELKDE